MKHMEAVDVRHTYYMINFLHERTTTQFKMMADNTRRKVKHNQRIAEADLCRYIDEVKENIDNLPIKCGNRPMKLTKAQIIRP